MLWLIQHQLRSNDVGIRRQAAEQLCQTPQRRAFRLFRKLLQDQDSEVRSLAVTALGKIIDARRLEPVLEALRDPDPGVVKAATLALKKYPEDRVRTALAPLLRHADAGVRGHAAQVLEAVGWQPPNRDDEIWYLVAKGRFSQAVAFGAAALSALEA